MEKHALIDRLQHLRTERHAWDRERNGDRLVATAGPLTLTIDGVRGNQPVWMAEADGFGILIPWTPARDVVDAITNATEFGRAHVLGLTQEQHAG